MKKLTLIVSALALLIGFSQCKKEVITPNTNDQGVHITLNAGYGQNGQKTDFDAGSFVWTNDATEYVYVGGANHSGCIGVLSGTGNGTATMTFTGELTDTPAEGETLHFFYLGKGRDGSAVNTLDFSSQDGTNVTNYHIAIGSATYDDGTSNYSATLNMAMAIAYFDLSRFNNDSKSAETVYLSGNDVYSTASINYKEGTITGNSKGQIKLGTANNGMYVALIPSVTTSTTLNFNSSSKTGSMTFNNGIKPAYFYSNSGGALLVEATTGSGIPGTFSVSDDKKVFFSKGNLQYQASTGTWRFAEHQYTAIGNNAGNNNFTGTRSTQSDWIDLFGWGTSGWNNGNTDYLPYNNWYTTASTSGYGYGPISGSSTNYPLTGDYANADWGVYNTIENGGIGWRTLTGGTTSDAEWYYLLFTRTASTIGETENARFAKAKVGTYYGLVLFPDSYSHPSEVALPQGINVKGSDGWYANNYSMDDWVAMEAAGAIFLPMTGRTENASVYNSSTGVAYYWSASNNSTNKAYGFYFASGQLECSSYNRYYGYAVRLVKDVK